MAFKSSSEPVPVGFEDMWPDTFCLMIQMNTNVNCSDKRATDLLELMQLTT